MKLAYSSNAYRRFDLDTAIDRVAAAGYGAIEIMADRPHAWPPDIHPKRAGEIRDRVASRGLAISNINAFMMCAVRDFWRPSWIEPDESYRRLRVDHTIASLRLARQLGAARITTEPGGPIPEGVPREQALDWFIEGLNEALSVAEGEGVSLLVEPEPELLVECADQFLELAARIDSPAFGLNFDIGHFYCVRDDLPATIARLAKYTAHYHIEDIAATRVHEHIIPGRGAIDFRAALTSIRATGYGGWLTVELYPYLDDPDGAANEARRFLLPLLTS